MKKVCPIPIHGIFTLFASLVFASLIFSYYKREQIITKIFFSALKADFILYLTSKLTFPLKINKGIIYVFILRYQTHMEGVMDDINNVCCFGSLFISLNTSTVYSMSHLFIKNLFTFGFVILLEVEYCTILKGALRLYKKCI